MTERPWDVLLLGGASGVGKSHVSYPLAAELGVNLTAVDDVHIILERMTTPDRYPAVHLWRLHPERVLELDEAGALAHTLEYGAVVSEALEPVIANHLDSRVRLMLEGDFILPSLATRSTYDDVPADGRVRALFLYEEEEERIARNFAQREGEEQPWRARACWVYSEWLRDECGRLGITAIPARPWETALERALAAVS